MWPHALRFAQGWAIAPKVAPAPGPEGGGWWCPSRCFTFTSDVLTNSCPPWVVRRRGKRPQRVRRGSVHAWPLFMLFNVLRNKRACVCFVLLLSLSCMISFIELLQVTPPLKRFVKGRFKGNKY